MNIANQGIVSKHNIYVFLDTLSFSLQEFAVGLHIRFVIVRVVKNFD